jgi:ParB-like chromosome segregation protein Spo0J
MDSKITPEGAVQVLMQDQIIDPVDPMRTDMDRDELYQLAENIKQNGLINPITVRPLENGAKITKAIADTLH